MAEPAPASHAAAVEPWSSLGRMLVWLGAVIALVGALLWLGPQIPGLGRLPGDVRIERPGLRLYFPITTGVLISVVLSLGLYLLSKLR
jgi:hypothetical protein